MLKKLIDLLFPPRCVLCGEVRPLSADGLCDECGRVPEKVLRRFLAVYAGKNAYTLECRAPYQYRGPIRGAIRRFKFGGEHSLAPVLAKKMLPAAGEAGPFDCVVPVPVSAERRRERGYDQSELLAKALSSLLGVPCRTLLEKTRHNRTQHELSRREREENVRGVYRSGPAAQGLRILLVDDIVTTGATAQSAAQALFLAGAVRVTVCALAFSGE